jgi:alkylation response protein AidB-like acyl-CoA dehydrogenase
MFALTDEQEMIVDSVQRLAEQEFAEDAFEMEEEVPWGKVKTLAENGFHCVNVSEKYGGGGLSEFETALIVETIGRVDPFTAQTTYSQSMVSAKTIEMFGSETAKERYLPPITAGESVVVIAMSEPEAGSDVQAMDTVVTEHNNGEMYINGEKIWCSQFPEADAAVVWTKFPSGSIGSVIVDLDDPGIEPVNHYTNMFGGSQTHFFLEDVRIPPENVLVRGKDTLKNQLKSLNWERCGNAMMSNALALCAFDKALAYAQEREQFDQPISDFQGIQWKLAEMAKSVQASRSLTYAAAKGAENNNGTPDRLQTSIAKLFSAQMVEQVTSEALQIHGATGYMKGHPVEWLYRRARSRRIGAGTDEIQKNNIAEAILKRNGFA